MGKRENWEEILEGEKGSEMCFGWKKINDKNFLSSVKKYQGLSQRVSLWKRKEISLTKLKY